MNVASDRRMMRLENCENVLNVELPIVEPPISTNNQEGGLTISGRSIVSDIAPKLIGRYKSSKTASEFEFDVKSSNTRLLRCLANYQLTSKEPWPEQGIYSYSNIADGGWGYLYQFENGEFVFDSAVRPSDKKIMSRWSGYFK